MSAVNVSCVTSEERIMFDTSLCPKSQKSVLGESISLSAKQFTDIDYG